MKGPPSTLVQLVQGMQNVAGNLFAPLMGTLVIKRRVSDISLPSENETGLKNQQRFVVHPYAEAPGVVSEERRS